MKRPKKSPDTNRPRRLKGVLGVLLVIGLILIIPLFFTTQIPSSPPVTGTVATPWVTFTPSPSWTFTPSMLPTSYQRRATATPLATRAKKPPTCKFPLAQTTITESAPEDYIFSEPQVVLSPSDNEADAKIVEWLPDSERVLLVQDFVESGKQDIELFNPQAGRIQVYATRQTVNELPVWVAGLNVVIYPETKLLLSTQNEFERQLWISRGNPKSTRLLEGARLIDDQSVFSVVVKPGGGQIAYRTQEDKRLSKRDSSLAKLKSVSFDPAQWDYLGENSRLLFGQSYMMAWRPGTSQIFLYSYPYSNADNDIGYTFLLDADNGKVCELDFEGWAFSLGRWSSDGRYLAIVRAQARSLAVNSTDLAILDVANGKLYSMGVVPQEIAGEHYVADFAWAPDNHHLLVIGSVLSSLPCATGCSEDTKLYLVDFLAGQVGHLFPSSQFTANYDGAALAWSPDGSKVLALCPQGLCLISVQRTGQ